MKAIERKRPGGYSKVPKGDTKGFLIEVQRLQRAGLPIHMTSLSQIYHVGRRKIAELPDLRFVEITDEYIKRYSAEYTRSVNASKRGDKDSVVSILDEMRASIDSLEESFRQLAERYELKSEVR